MSTVVLITGTNRGLGRGLLERYLALPNHTVIGANRSPEQASSQSLYSLPRAEGTRLILVKLDATIWSDAFDAVKTLEQEHGITHIDVVIGNAGVSYIWPKVADVKLEDIEGHFKPNVYGQVALYQATRHLLKKAWEKTGKSPVLTTMGSTAGSISSPLPFPNAAYGPSKLAAAWYTVKIHLEEDWLNSFSLVPGWVRTDLGSAGADSFGVDEATRAKLMIGTDESCDSMMKVLAATSREEHGGKLVLYTGEILPW